MATLTQSGSCLLKAGANVSTDLSGAGNTTLGLNAEKMWDVWIKEAEGLMSSISREDWVDKFATLGTNQKEVLSDICASIAAMKGISYDMSGYTAKREAETMLDVQRDNMSRGMKLIKEDNVKKFLEGL